MVYKNLRRFNPNFEIEEWCYAKLLSEEKIENYPFYNKSRMLKNQLVPLLNIIGTTNDSYVGKRWIDLPYNMKKFSDKYNVENFMQFLAASKIQNKQFNFIKYGDNYIISGCNHRTCQAKFSNIESVYSSTEEYIFDSEMYEIFQILSNEGLSPKIDMGSNKKYYRDSYWEISINNKVICFSNFLCINKFVQHYNKYAANLRDRIIQKFSTRKILNWYNESSDYKNLKNEIVIYKSIKKATLLATPKNKKD